MTNAKAIKKLARQVPTRKIEQGDIAGVAENIVPATQSVSVQTRSKRNKGVSESLIPIKGISNQMAKALARSGIFDIPSLLSRCKTQIKRNGLAARLGIDVKYVNSWTKQADLWRVEGMTADMAYLLVQAGIRGVEDLAKVDVDKIYPVLWSLAEVQPDFVLMSRLEVSNLKEAAKEIMGIVATSLTNISSNYGFESTGIEMMYETDVEEKSVEDQKLSAAWKDLFEFDCILPLPKYISGTIMQRSIASDSEPVPMQGVKVEIPEGYASTAKDNLLKSSCRECYTDATGHFIISLPSQYSFKESVRLVVSNARGSQDFLINASDIISSVEEAGLVDAIQNVLSKRISYRKDASLQKEFIAAVEAVKNGYGAKLKEMSLAAEVEALKNIALDDDDDIFDTALNSIFTTIVKKSTLEAKLKGSNPLDGRDYFLVTTEVFTGERTDVKKALPSVKLMGDDDDATMLSTDTAPSKMYSYSMLQRLIEPAVKQRKDAVASSPATPDAAGNAAADTRTKIDSPIDIAEFKEKMTAEPDDYALMCSLGLGYQLNMHQAWVPDGFALGDLLYSLILAPGEEQRLIVREKTQTYQLTDISEGTDNVDESYQASQTDDTSAVYNYAVDQLMKANSSYETDSYSYGTGITGGGFFGSGAFGMSGSFAGTNASGSASASQSNSHNEVSSVAQQFQQSIKAASNKLSQAKRLSVSTASSNVSDSVATKIIANHNHSHAMTIQYWEVMRRYKLETAVDSVDLVLFIPLKVIKFLPKGADVSQVTLKLDGTNPMNKTLFDDRYAEILKYASALEPALPYRYRSGLNLIRQYSANPDWTYEQKNATSSMLTLKFESDIMTFDRLSAYVVLKSGKGKLAGSVKCDAARKIEDTISTKEELKNAIRNREGLGKKVKEAVQTADGGYISQSRAATPTVTCTFTLPSNVIPEDIESIRIKHSCDSFEYELYKDEDVLTPNQKTAWSSYLHKENDFAKDNDDSSGDSRSMAHYAELLPEAFKSPKLTFTSSEMEALGAPSLGTMTLTYGDETLQAFSGDNLITRESRVTVLVMTKTLRRSELQKIEETFQHIVTNNIKYSQAVWASLTSDERAMLLDQYTVDMDYSKLRASGSGSTNTERVNIPLLNCVNVRKLLGFYGNCMLLPFTFPQELEKKLGRSAAEVQDQIYRYHTNCFRAPTTVISMPTSGMIGEAVLGQTNVSELIDLTRFWNWKDSPIDSMSVDNQYLDTNDYLKDKKTQGLTALNLQGVTAPTVTQMPQAISSLVNRQTPTFGDLTGQTELSTLISSAMTSSSSGRDKMVDQTTAIANTALGMAQKQMEAELNAKTKLEEAKIKQGGQTDETSEGGEAAPTKDKAKTPGATGSGEKAPGATGGGESKDKTVAGGGGQGGSGQNTDVQELKKLVEKLKGYFKEDTTPTPEEFLEFAYKAFGGTTSTDSGTTPAAPSKKVGADTPKPTENAGTVSQEDVSDLIKTAQKGKSK